MDKIFVSFSSKDRAYVDTFLLASQDYSNLNLWASHKSSLSSGENFHNTIKKEIASSDGAIIFVSNSSLTSEFINEIELPEIFKRKTENSNYKIALVFVDKCTINENEYLKNLQFINSLSTSLENSTSNQIDNIISEVFSSIISNSGSKQNRSKLKNTLFVWLPLTLILLFIFNSINSIEEVPEETSVEEPLQITISENESPANEPLLCFSNKINEVWDINWISSPVKNANLPIVDCEGKIFGHVFYKIDLNLTTEDLTESLINTILSEATQECFTEFKTTYGYTSNETLLDYQFLFTESDQKQIELLCFSVFVTVNVESFDAFTLELIDIDIENYRASNGMYLTNLFDFKTGECLIFPDSVYGPSSTRLSDQAYSSNCSSPHGLQVIKTFNFTPNQDSNIETIEDTLWEKCGIYSDILLSSLEEVKNKRTPFGYSYVDSYFFTDDEKLRNNEEVKVLCVVGNSNVMDIKVNYDYLDLVDKKVFKRELSDNTFLKISNCSDEPLKAVLPDDDDLFSHDFLFEWSSPNSDIAKLNFSFKDEDYFIDLDYAPESDFEKNLTRHWETIIIISPVAFSNNDKLEVIATMELENGESYSDSCLYSLYLDE